jgi:hypothetical protein
MPKRPQLTATVQQSIVAYLRAGGFAHVAAEAAGVPRELFEEWLRKGRTPGAPARYRAFHQAVMEAQAQGRLGAEVAVRNERPLDWLRNGPGRDAPDRPGWSAPVRPEADAGRAAVLLQPEVQALIQALLGALEAFPEARAAAAAALAPKCPQEGPIVP